MNNLSDETSGKKSRIWLILFVTFAVILAACIGVFIYHKIEEKDIADLLDDVKVTDSSDTEDFSLNTDASVETESPVNVIDEFSEEIAGEISSIDFALLRESAPDVYAWLRIPGTKVDYPIVRREGNNKYYVRRSIKGRYDVTGCIFSEDYNSPSFDDPDTLIYGHYMPDGTKFGSLLKYMDREYFDTYRDVVIYTDTHKLEYKIFAALPFDTRHVLLSYEIYGNGFEMFLDDVYSSQDPRAVYADDITVDPAKDKIITLSTCLKNGSKRYLVLAVLTRSQYCE